jgi:AraC-like DNA-binding protein/mannose-6-phosphate isomerase-like protein (cupin superfamily)
MKESPSPFERRPGFNGVAVSLADKRWYLRNWHAHETLEINLVLRGSGQVLLEDRRYPLLPGHLVWLWPGQRHVPANWSADILLWIVEWQPDGLGRFHRARRRDDPAPAAAGHSFCRRLAAPAVQRLDGLLACLAARTRADAFNRGLDFALFALWEEYLAATPVADCALFHPKLETVIALLANPGERLSHIQLARRVGLSPCYLSALFQKQTGLTMPAFRNRLRLREFFRRLHAHPEIRLLQHALDAGFGSYAQFHRVFRAALGVSPASGSGFPRQRLSRQMPHPARPRTAPRAVPPIRNKPPGPAGTGRLASSNPNRNYLT